CASFCFLAGAIGVIDRLTVKNLPYGSPVIRGAVIAYDIAGDPARTDACNEHHGQRGSKPYSALAFRCLRRATIHPRHTNQLGACLLRTAPLSARLLRVILRPYLLPRYLRRSLRRALRTL